MDIVDQFLLSPSVYVQLFLNAVTKRSQPGSQSARQADIHTYRQTDRQTDTDRRTDRTGQGRAGQDRTSQDRTGQETGNTEVCSIFCARNLEV